MQACFRGSHLKPDYGPFLAPCHPSKEPLITTKVILLTTYLSVTMALRGLGNLLIIFFVILYNKSDNLKDNDS